MCKISPYKLGLLAILWVIVPHGLPYLAIEEGGAEFQAKLTQLIKEQNDAIDKLEQGGEKISNEEAVDAAVALLLKENLSELQEALKKGGLTLALDKLKELIERIKKENPDRELILNGVDGFVLYDVLAKLLELHGEQEGLVGEVPPAISGSIPDIKSLIQPLTLETKISYCHESKYDEKYKRSDSVAQFTYHFKTSPIRYQDIPIRITINDKDDPARPMYLENQPNEMSVYDDPKNPVDEALNLPYGALKKPLQFKIFVVNSDGKRILVDDFSLSLQKTSPPGCDAWLAAEDPFSSPFGYHFSSTVVAPVATQKEQLLHALIDGALGAQWLNYLKIQDLIKPKKQKIEVQKRFACIDNVSFPFAYGEYSKWVEERNKLYSNIDPGNMDEIQRREFEAYVERLKIMSGAIMSTKHQIEKKDNQIEGLKEKRLDPQDLFREWGQPPGTSAVEFLIEKIEKERNNLSLHLYHLYDQYPLLGFKMPYGHRDEELWQILSSINTQLEEYKRAEEEYERKLANYNELSKKYPNAPEPQKPIRKKRDIADINQIVRKALEQASQYALDTITGKASFKGLCGFAHASAPERRENLDEWLGELLPFETLRVETLTRMRNDELTELAHKELEKIRKEERDMVGVSIPLYIGGMVAGCGLGLLTGGISCGVAITLFGAAVSAYELSDHYARHLKLKEEVLWMDHFLFSSLDEGALAKTKDWRKAYDDYYENMAWAAAAGVFSLWDINDLGKLAKNSEVAGELVKTFRTLRAGQKVFDEKMASDILHMVVNLNLSPEEAEQVFQGVRKLFAEWNFFEVEHVYNLLTKESLTADQKKLVFKHIFETDHIAERPIRKAKMPAAGESSVEEGSNIKKLREAVSVRKVAERVLVPSTKLSPKEFVQAFYKKIKAMLPKVHPKQQVEDVLNLAKKKADALKKIEDLALKRQIDRLDKAKEKMFALEGDVKELIDRHIALKNNEMVKGAQALQNKIKSTVGADLLKDDDKIYKKLFEEIGQLREADPILAKNLSRQLRLKKALAELPPLAAGNAPHVAEVMQTIKENIATLNYVFEGLLGRTLTREEIENLMQFMRTLVAVHDLGKTFPAETVLEVARKMGANKEILMGHVMMHELSSAIQLQWLIQANNLGEELSPYLMRHILGHNDGSGLKHVFWNLAHSELGRYYKPNTVFSMLLAMADRGGQATLGLTGGVYKITKQEMLRGQKFGRMLLEKTMKENAENTILQIKRIAERFRRLTGVDLTISPMYKDLLARQKFTKDMFSIRIQWTTETSGKIGMQGDWLEFNDIESLFGHLNTVYDSFLKIEKKTGYWYSATTKHKLREQALKQLLTPEEGVEIIKFPKRIDFKNKETGEVLSTLVPQGDAYIHTTLKKGQTFLHIDERKAANRSAAIFFSPNNKEKFKIFGEKLEGFIQIETERGIMLFTGEAAGEVAIFAAREGYAIYGPLQLIGEKIWITHKGKHISGAIQENMTHIGGGNWRGILKTAEGEKIPIQVSTETQRVIPLERALSGQ